MTRAPSPVASGLAALRSAASPRLVAATVFFSIFVNLLMLTGPLYMLQVYDRVLGSRSEATLVALSLLAAFLFLAMGLLDHARGRILARIGARLAAQLDRRLFHAALARSAAFPGDDLAASAPRDLHAVQAFWSSPIVTALMDLPFTPLFLAAIFIFHPLLGWLALLGGALLLALTLLQQHLSRPGILASASCGAEADRLATRLTTEAELLRSLGMVDAAFARWSAAREQAQVASLDSADLTGAFQAATRTLRLFLQSAILGLGAWLVLQGELSPGAMIAASILVGRALSPIEQAIGHWPLLTRAVEGRAALARLLSLHPPEAARIALPRPRALLEGEGLTLLLPGTAAPVLRGLSFRLEPGQALGLIGTTGAGKSTLGRALVGALRPVAGKIRLDGAELSQYDPEALGRYIGYLPQSVTLFDATVAENIARLTAAPDSQAVIAAARAAAAHDMILRLPLGYDTPLGPGGMQLSGGQIQRIGLARALFGDPVLLVLDEPNANLDHDGSLALNMALRAHKARGGAAIIIAHRPAAIQECDLLLMIEDGSRRAFGPRDEVLRAILRNASDLVRPAPPEPAATQGSVA